MNLDFISLNLYINIWSMNIKIVISEILIFFLFIFLVIYREFYILFFIEKKIMLCINCFRDMKM